MDQLTPAARRLQEALELYGVGVEMKRLSLRRANPGADESEISRMLVEWLHRTEESDPPERSADWPHRVRKPAR